MVYFGCCHLLATDALHLLFHIAIQALVSWWGRRLNVNDDCGSLVCTICYMYHVYFNDSKKKLSASECTGIQIV